MLQRKYNGVCVFCNTFLENQGNFLKALNIFEKSTYLFFILFFFLHFLYKKERKKVVCFDSLDRFYFTELLHLSYYLLSSFISNY